MEIKDFTDMQKFEKIMANWAAATGLATVAVGADSFLLHSTAPFCKNAQSDRMVSRFSLAQATS